MERRYASLYSLDRHRRPGCDRPAATEHHSKWRPCALRASSNWCFSASPLLAL